MKCAAHAAWSAILLVGMASAAFSATAELGSAPSKGETTRTARSLEAAFGKTLISIDGSTIEIRAAEGRLSREIVAPNGAVQRSNLVFINARLGTVVDTRDASRVTGVFRASDQEILIQYGDGSSEIVRPNPQGGLTIETTSPKAPTYCTSWYPEGHVFTLDDRKAALVQYANRLGLGASIEKAGATPDRAGCDSVATAVTPASATAPAAVNAPEQPPAMPATLQPPAVPPAANISPAEKAAALEAAKPNPALASVLPRIAEATAKAASEVAAGVTDTTALGAAKMAELPPTSPVEVRTSDVQLIDQPRAETMPVVAMSQEGGASTCLTVESDGMNWGFRNKCNYSIQYAYCTMDGRNQLTACRDGSVGGSVAPNGFGVLIADQNLRSVNENHDFRWVACQGGAGEVIARLDRSDPPMGRCVR
jgi:hypothetical protein